ncbi:acyl-CoA dehydrogenase family protein [Pseudonocardia sp. WMMC193]|uniref:acyl-CoA dehydrogenase family protein n=1 Tax=Pseudonocardia sp. WMMC193 TaxID=2911965 RepID=UPI001F33CF6E|nr:acyl-CoA dehydrogenase family protein [Pseudonocardia sp. WMMC193]MCF7549136.1 acyl-CoA dehydrogenase family protein [Pseudonocardia sp. WMMC193]
MAWDFSTEPEFEKKLAWMREFVREEIYPIETLDLSPEQYARITAPLKEQVKEQGLWAAHLPPELGGGGFGQVKLGLMHEILGASRFAPGIFGNQAPDSGNAELLAIGGSPEQKEQWMFPLLRGELRSCFSMTEPGAGADPTLLTTRAVLEGDEYVINGHKWFSSNASRADFLIVMAVTDPDVSPYQGSSMIIVPVDTPGVTILRDIPVMDHSTVHPQLEGGHAEILYQDVRVPKTNLVGNPGDGFKLAQQRLGPGRIHHAMRWLGQSKRAFDMLCERAVSRYAHGSVLADKQMIQDWVATSAAEMQAARLLTLQAAWTMDQVGASNARNEIAMIKFWGARVLHDVIDRAIQIHGSLGFSGDLPLEQMYRAARAARIYDGPDEVHKATLAKRILRGYEAVDVPTEHVPTRTEAARTKFAQYLELATAND